MPDTAQADTLIQMLAKKRPIELAEAWQEAWGTGARWRDKLEKGRARLGLEAQEALDMVARKLKESRQRDANHRIRKYMSALLRSAGTMCD